MRNLLTLAASTLLASAIAASAATLDFAAEAAGNERGVADGTTLSISGLDVTFTATGGSAYFDDVSGGRDGGLGVCTTLTASAQCNPSSDDNISANEAVFLTFANSGFIDSGLFRDADHYLFNGFFEYSLNGGADWLTAAVVNGLFNFNSAFTEAGLGFRSIGYQFYVTELGSSNGAGISVNPVPLPAGMVLLGTGIAAFGVWSRKNKRKAA